MPRNNPPTTPRRGSPILACALLTAACLFAARTAVAADPACPASTPTHADLPATRQALFHMRPVTIVALGSSSTEGAGASAPDRTYPARLAALLRLAWPDVPVAVLNRGVGGQTIGAVMDRLESDVLAERPTLVIWQVGTNEALRGTDEARFAALLDEGVRRIVATGADLVLMDIQIAPRIPDDRGAAYDAIISREARQRHVTLFSRSLLMREWRADGLAVSEMIGPDGLHHTDRGYACLAESLGQAVTDAVAKGIPVAAARNK